MDKCHRHHKEYTSRCIWCGQQICEYCIARKEGRKVYCEKCAQNLGPVPRSIPKAA